MFPVTDSSQSIIDCLVREANKFGVEMMMNADVREIKKETESFSLKLADGRELKSDFVCIACGGFPKTSMFDWIVATGHTIENPVPSLFTFNLPSHPITKLMGVSIEKAHIKIIGSKLQSEGPLLITHWGLSGPAVLRLSAYAARTLAECEWRFRVLVNWIPHQSEKELHSIVHEKRINEARTKIHSRNSFGLPQRLWEFFCIESEIGEDLNWADLKSKSENKLISRLSAFEFEVNGKTTFKEEFVTAGGISLSEIDSQTMMSRKVPNLFFAGEILNVDGITGGFNFQHAWTSGYIAGESVANLV
jgi:predicted Rossmann fold flavoprotein